MIGYGGIAKRLPAFTIKTSDGLIECRRHAAYYHDGLRYGIRYLHTADIATTVIGFSAPPDEEDALRIYEMLKKDTWRNIGVCSKLSDALGASPKVWGG